MIKGNLLEKKNIFFCFFFIYLILSINNPPFWLPNNFISYIKSFLGVSPLVIFVICIIFLFINRSKLTLNLKNLIFLLLIIFNLLQLFSIFMTKELNTYHTIYWIVAACSLPLLIMSADIIDKRLQEYFLYIAIMFFTSLSVIFLVIMLYGTFISPEVSFSFYGHSALAPGQQIFGSFIPRSSGLGRLSVIAFLFFHLLYVHVKFSNKITNILIYLACIFFLFCSFHLQSRIIIGFILIYFLFNLLPFNKGKFFERSYKLIILFLLGFLLHLTFPLISGKIKYNYLNIQTNAGNIYPSLRMFFVKEILISERKQAANLRLLAKIELEKLKKDPLYVIENDFIRNNFENLINSTDDKIARDTLLKFLTTGVESTMYFTDLNNQEVKDILDGASDGKAKVLTDKGILKNYIKDVGIGRMTSNINSSGRLYIWSKALKARHENILLGRGPQSDRVFLGENMSNLYMYALFVGGLFALLIIIIMIAIIIYICFKETFINLELKKDKNFLKKFSLFCIGFFIIRSLAENSFAVFGIDYVLFFLSVSVISTDKKFNFSNR